MFSYNGLIKSVGVCEKWTDSFNDEILIFTDKKKYVFSDMNCTEI